LSLVLSKQRPLSDTRKKTKEKAKKKSKDNIVCEAVSRHLSPIHPTINRQIMRNRSGRILDVLSPPLLKRFDGQFVRTSPDHTAWIDLSLFIGHAIYYSQLTGGK
jgi:hypothetical protein